MNNIAHCIVVPFCNISRCSQRMSPMKAGALARNASLPIPHMSLPLILKVWRVRPSSENSRVAQRSQWATCVSVHCRGSAEKKERNETTCIMCRYASVFLKVSPSHVENVTFAVFCSILQQHSIVVGIVCPIRREHHTGTWRPRDHSTANRACTTPAL